VSGSSDDAGGVRRLVLILGDQLWRDNPALVDLDLQRDQVLLIEAPGESTTVWSHKARITLFLSAMRHFSTALRATGLPVAHVHLEAEGPDTLEGRLLVALRRYRPQALWCTEPGEWRLEQGIKAVCAQAGVACHFQSDTHFLCSRKAFAQWASRYRGSLRMEFFYREMRKRHGVLMDAEGQPQGGRWNFDADNRKGYPKTGPGEIPAPAGFEPDAITLDVMDLVDRRFPDHPAAADWRTRFVWPVTREQALQALERFVQARLRSFGPYQDAMWDHTPLGWHSLLSSSLNLHLLDPREVIGRVAQAYEDGEVELSSAEGYIRQVLGWREFIRGVYWLDMPGMRQANHFAHARPLPGWFWTGRTEMACARDAIGQTLALGYAHHIQRLMVTGLFALLAQLDPRQVADWYLAVYVDAVEWAELPNVAGMALYANGGRFTSKPYAASGAYIQRMSNHCKGCRYRPGDRTGERACPYTTLYWHFLIQHEQALLNNPRTTLMARHVARLSLQQRQDIQACAEDRLARLDTL